jgi:hypothetical protein
MGGLGLVVLPPSSNLEYGAEHEQAPNHKMADVDGERADRFKNL